MVIIYAEIAKILFPQLIFPCKENPKKIVGHLAYSRGVVRDETGAENEIIRFRSLSVLPNYQKQGVGSALIRGACSYFKRYRLSGNLHIAETQKICIVVFQVFDALKN